MIKLGKEISHVPTLYTGYQRMAITYSYRDDYENSNEYYRKGLKLSIENKEYACIAVMHLNIGINYSIQNQYDSTLYHSKKSAKNFLIANDSSGYAGSLGLSSSTYYRKGQYQLALENALEEMRIYERYDDIRSKRAALSVKGKIANNYLKMKDTAMALKYFKNTIPILRERDDKLNLTANLAGIGFILVEKNETLEEAKNVLEETRNLSNQLKNITGLINANFGLGKYHKKRKNYSKAKQYFQESLRLSDSLKQISNSVDNKIQLAEVALLEKNSPLATTLAQEALDISLENELLEDQSHAYNILYLAKQRDRNYKEAFNYHQLFKKTNDSIYNKENGARLSELQTIYETEKKESEIALQQEEIKTLNERAKVDKLTKGLYGGGAVVGIALSGLLFFGFRQRMKKNKIEREKQEEIYKQEIEFKKKELASQTLHLVQKNSFLAELKENLENLKNSPDKFKMEFKRLVMLLKKESSGDKDWEVFKSYFAEVHDNFDNKLKAVYADISEKEIRLASFLKMNLSTKEIADMLNVLPDSVLKSKYRLKKKLNLDKETDLYQYLSRL